VRPRWAKTNWIVSARYDLFFFIGSCALTWVFLGLYHGLRSAEILARPESVLVTYFVFTALFDHPHIFQTFARTHADRREHARHRLTHTVGLAAFIVAGFVLAGLGYLRQLIVVAAIWGSWHIIRQHWGFLRAYKAVNGDTARIDDLLDGALFYSGMLGFLLYDYAGITGETPIYGSLRVTFPSIPPWIADVAWYAFLVVLALFVVRQLVLLRARALNVPKLVFLLAALGTHGLVFRGTSTPFLVAESLETAYHNVQYQGWIMHYQRRRFGGTRVVLRWLAMALAYGLVVGTIEVIGLTEETLSWVFLPFFMIVLYHYYVDGKIWKLSKDPELRQAMFAR
jgi:hypothetical protein